VRAASARERLPHLGHRFRQPSRTEAPPAEPAIFLVDAQTPDVSSTEIRRRMRAGERISGLVPPAVEAHILRHRLYVESTTADYCQ
jgi:nicotinic acid mononucleotide adenylyltransferase